jgi:hypothetical protein
VANTGTTSIPKPEPDVDPLANLGPLPAMAGAWEGTVDDEHPASVSNATPSSAEASAPDITLPFGSAPTVTTAHAA